MTAPTPEQIDAALAHVNRFAQVIALGGKRYTIAHPVQPDVLSEKLMLLPLDANLSRAKQLRAKAVATMALIHMGIPRKEIEPLIAAGPDREDPKWHCGYVIETLQKRGKL